MYDQVLQRLILLLQLIDGRLLLLYDLDALVDVGPLVGLEVLILLLLLEQLGLPLLDVLGVSHLFEHGCF